MSELPDPARMAPEDRILFSDALEQHAGWWPAGSGGRTTCRELAALYRHCERRYPEAAIPSRRDDAVLPVSRAAPVFSTHGSPGRMCTEGAWS